MAIRNVLHKNHVIRLSDWLTSKGWEEKHLKGDYEHMRFKRGKGTFIAYERVGSEHLSYEERHHSMIMTFLKEDEGWI